MKKVYLLISGLLLLAVISFVSCNNSPTNSTNKATPTGNIDTTETPDQSIESEVEPTDDSTVMSASDQETFTITAKFVEFSLGDASHYAFEDEEGKMWDFGGNDDNNFEFARELDESEMDSDNQGWGSNEELQGKFFEITYYKKEQPLYIDGPMGTVDVISKVTLKR